MQDTIYCRHFYYSRNLGTSQPYFGPEEEICPLYLISHPRAKPNLRSVSFVLLFLAIRYIAQYLA